MKKALFILSLNLSLIASAQVNFSLATGLSGLRNFSPQQQFWAIGQTVQLNFHFSPKQTAYASLEYFTEGKYHNNFTATAKSSSTNPQQITYTATGRISYRQISLGFKHFFKGSFNSEKDLSFYGLAGFGYLFTKLSNSSSVAIDSSLYLVRPIIGAGKLDRLTFDLGIGTELPLGGNFFIFAEGRTWLPASSTGNPYLHNQKNVPLPFIASAGLRLLFGLSY